MPKKPCCSSCAHGRVCESTCIANLEAPVKYAFTSAADFEQVYVLPVKPGKTPRVTWWILSRDSSGNPKRIPGLVLIGWLSATAADDGGDDANTALMPLYADDEGETWWVLDKGEDGGNVPPADGAGRYKLYFKVEASSLAAGDVGQVGIEVRWT